jgi:DNA helicase-2/ATP-dependent DNA helicase PcrA
VTGLPGRRRLFAGGGELLEIAVAAPIPLTEVPLPAPFDLSFVNDWAPPPSELPPVLPEPLSLKEFHDREKGKQFGEKVHKALEAAPPPIDPWPPREPPPPAVSWGEGEERRWESICRTIAASSFQRELRRTSLVGTEIPMLTCREGIAKEERADLVVRAPGGGYWVVDYKTGRREQESEAEYFRQVRNYMEILAEASGVPVCGFVWYVETGEAVQVTWAV